jgi:hypothetical protein
MEHAEFVTDRRCDEPRLDAGLRCPIGQSARDMRLADPGWSEQDDILGALDERETCQKAPSSPRWVRFTSAGGLVLHRR